MSFLASLIDTEAAGAASTGAEFFKDLQDGMMPHAACTKL
jgi:hypothetical protein